MISGLRGWRLRLTKGKWREGSNSSFFELVRLWFRSPRDGLAAMMKATFPNHHTSYFFHAALRSRKNRTLAGPVV
jgi:hypothetical protein